MQAVEIYIARYAYPLIKMNKSLLSFDFDIYKIDFNEFFLFFFFWKSITASWVHDNIETNPGPIKKSKFFICCHWNVNCLTAHNMLKLSSIAAYNSIYKYDFFSIGETNVDSSVQSVDRDFSISAVTI